MKQQPNHDRVHQNAKNSNGNITQVGRDYKNTSNIFIPVFLIGILALGGLAWALTVGVNNHGQNPQSGQQKSEQQKSSP